MNKKKFETPEMEVMRFSPVDVIVASVGGGEWDPWEKRETRTGGFSENE